MRVCIYARVSTAEQQSLPAQINALNSYAEKRGWEVVAQIEEVGSGGKQRPKRQEVLAAARRREIDGVLVWKLDRWGRSVQDLVTTLNEFVALGVTFTSLTEALDFSTPSGRAMAGMLGVFAQFEHDIIRERVKSGLAHAKTMGKELGRPRSAMSKKSEVLKLSKRKFSNSEIARQLGIDRRSVKRVLDSSSISL